MRWYAKLARSLAWGAAAIALTLLVDPAFHSLPAWAFAVPLAVALLALSAWARCVYHATR